MTEELYSSFVINATNSIYALILIIIIGFAALKITKKYNDSERKRKQLRNRTLYICLLVYVFLLARIWVEGFTHILAVLGLVSAALVITNKETIMNLVGWLIINWRELFTEGDLVQIDKNKGYIKSIGLLYITMEETIEQSGYLKTGRILKLPNNHIILHPTINYTYDSRPILQKHELQFKPNSDIYILKETLSNIISDIINEANNDRKQHLTKQSAKHKNIDDKQYHISFTLKHDKELRIEAIIYFYCYLDEFEKVKINFISKIIDKIDASDNVFLI